jgi:predicted ArsR family transcriptional regulator
MEQAVREVVETLTKLSFAPDPPVRREDAVSVDVRHCPFSVDPKDPDGAIVCGFHEGLIRGLAETASGEEVAVRLMPFIAPGLCRVEISAQKAPRTARRRTRPKK